MKSQPPDVFLELKEKLQSAKKSNSNLLVYTFAGSGCTHYLKELARQDKELTYINNPGISLGKYNLLDLPLGDAVLYTKLIDVKQKYLLTISSGIDFYSPTVREIISHSYLNFPLRAGSSEDIKDMLVRFTDKNDSQTVQLIMRLSGGIPKLAKYLIVHNGEFNENDNTYLTLINSISSSISDYNPTDLRSLSLTDENGNFLSELLGKYAKRAVEIKINFDLSFEEKGIVSKEKLTSVESKIIKKMLDNGGKISKEEVSDIKWGMGKYDQFSDQAINKQMRRLSQKFKIFSIKTIPKVGFEFQ